MARVWLVTSALLAATALISADSDDDVLVLNAANFDREVRHCYLCFLQCSCE